MKFFFQYIVHDEGLEWLREILVDENIVHPSQGRRGSSSSKPANSGSYHQLSTGPPTETRDERRKREQAERRAEAEARALKEEKEKEEERQQQQEQQLLATETEKSEKTEPEPRVVPEAVKQHFNKMKDKPKQKSGPGSRKKKIRIQEL